MTAYLSANLRHTDKRLQQSGPAVVVLRHRVRARRGSALMNIDEVGGAMTSCSRRLFCALLRSSLRSTFTPFYVYISSFTPNHFVRLNTKTFSVFEHFAKRNRALSAGRQGVKL